MPVFSDVDIELTKATDGDVTLDIEAEAIKNSIGNILQTMKGSRRMLPEFASDLYNLLFEPMDEDTAYLIGNRILEAIERWDDRVIIENIRIDPVYDNNEYRIFLTFRIENNRQTEVVEYILKKL